MAGLACQQKMVFLESNKNACKPNSFNNWRVGTVNIILNRHLSTIFEYLIDKKAFCFGPQK